VKVLQINSVCGIGSTGRIATDIHNILVEQGHESYIAYGREEAKNCDKAIKIGTDLDNYSHVALTRVFDRHGFGSKKATEDFIGEIENLDPDLIHLHNIHGYYINVEMLFEYLKKVNKPVIWTLHDCWAFTGHCTHFDYVGCDKWKTGCFSCPEKKSYPKSTVIDNSMLNYKNKKEIFSGVKNLTIVTPSNWLANLVEQSYLSEYPVEVINNGVDLEIFKPVDSDFRRRNGIINKFIILGVAGVWNVRKGYDYFLELSNRIKSDEIIVMVGLSKKQKNELPDNIIGITHTNNINELAEIYSTSDVFVNPTLEDNFPTTNLESLACGTPVVTFNTGGSLECLNNDSGHVVKKEDVTGLIDSIQTVKKIGKLSYSEKSIRRAENLYKNKDRFNEYVDLYKKLKIKMNNFNDRLK
jgi:putative colanic acid biosynthesis glycosyltransferase